MKQQQQQQQQQLMGFLLPTIIAGTAAAAAAEPSLWTLRTPLPSKTATVAASPARWWWRRREEEEEPSASLSMELSLPPLLQRPRYPSTTTDDNQSNPQKSPLTKTTTDDDNTSTNTVADVLRLMDALQIPVDDDLYLPLLKECTRAGDSPQALNLHSHIHRHRRSGHHHRLLLLHAACGHVGTARLLFDEMPARDPVSWALIIAALAHHGRHEDTIRLFVAGFSSDELTRFSRCFPESVESVLRSCVRTRGLGLGRQLHGLALKIGSSDRVYRILAQLYAVSGHRRCARMVLDSTSGSANAWGCLVSGCCREGKFDDAFYNFREMGRAGVRKSRYTFSSVLRACAEMDDEGRSGRQVHGLVVKAGAEIDMLVGSGLVRMYAECGLVGDAGRVFETAMGTELRVEACNEGR